MTDQVTRAATSEELERARLAREATVATQPAPPTAAAPAHPKAISRPKKGTVATREIPFEYSDVEFDGVFYEKAVIRRLKGEDYTALQEGLTPNEIISRMTGLPIPVVDAMDGEDYFTVFEACQAFFPKALRRQMEAAALKASLSTHLSSRTSSDSPTET